MSKHRADVRPRYGRIVLLGASLSVTLVSVLGGSGLLPAALHGAEPASSVVRDPAGAATTPAATTARPTPPATTASTSPATPEPPTDRSASRSVDPSVESPAVDPATVLPADSGTGKRVVFSEGRQRVWLVADDGTVRRTYPVSGSTLDNLDPGTYTVYSRSEDAIGIDGSDMEWFVRFTRGPSGAAIGFHTIPTQDGEPVQTHAELGTPQSHGCIRQRLRDALALWDFAPLGTTVVVVP